MASDRNQPKAQQTMKNKRLIKTGAILAIACAVLFGGGCDSRPEMRERFEADRIMTDEHGRKYIVSHHFGTNYSVRPYDPEK